MRRWSLTLVVVGLSAFTSLTVLRSCQAERCNEPISLPGAIPPWNPTRSPSVVIYCNLLPSTDPLIDGSVVAVAGPFAILETDGTPRIGYHFDVYRGDNYIGHTVVRLAIGNTAFVQFDIMNRLGVKPRVGDKATTRL